MPASKTENVTTTAADELTGSTLHISFGTNEKAEAMVMARTDRNGEPQMLPCLIDVAAAESKGELDAGATAALKAMCRQLRSLGLARLGFK